MLISETFTPDVLKYDGAHTDTLGLKQEYYLDGRYIRIRRLYSMTSVNVTELLYRK